MMNRKHALRGILLLGSFIGGIIASIVVLALGCPEWYIFVCIGAGVLPACLWCAVVKTKERRGLKKIDTTGFEIKKATVKSCDVSSYKQRVDKTIIPNVFIITAQSGDDVYKVYYKCGYACGAEIELYVSADGKKVRIKEPESEAHTKSDLYGAMTFMEDVLFAHICDNCDDDTYDVVYNAWKTEMDAAGDDLTSREVLQARIALVNKYSDLLVKYEWTKQLEGLIHITETQMKEFFAKYDGGQEPDIKPLTGESENTEDIAPEQNEQEVADTADEPEQNEPQQGAKSAAVGYKGINRKIIDKK